MDITRETATKETKMSDLAAAIAELSDVDDDLLMTTTLDAINAHRQRKAVANLLAATQAEIAAENTETPDAPAARPRPAYANVTKTHHKMTATQRRALQAAVRDCGVIMSSKTASVTTLRALIRHGWATDIEGLKVDKHGREYTTLAGARLTPAGYKAATR